MSWTWAFQSEIDNKRRNGRQKKTRVGRQEKVKYMNSGMSREDGHDRRKLIVDCCH